MSVLEIKALIWAAVAALLVYGGYDVGQRLKQSEWDKAKAASAAAEQQRVVAVGTELLNAHKRADVAETLAAENESKLREAMRGASTKRLASCEQDRAAGPAGAPSRAPGEGGVPSTAAGVEPAPSAPGIRLHWRFVGLHDGAFTGLNGEPLFRASAEFSADPARADTPSPYGLGDLLAVEGENAVNFSACRRRLVEVKSAIERAAAAWDRSATR